MRIIFWTQFDHVKLISPGYAIGLGQSGSEFVLEAKGSVWKPTRSVVIFALKRSEGAESQHEAVLATPHTAMNINRRDSFSMPIESCK